MRIGVLKEVKNNEYRVALIPSGVHELVNQQHQVIIETGAGDGIGISDEDYQHAGAKLVDDAQTVFALSDLIIKVKEPSRQECSYLRDGQIIFAYLHLAADRLQSDLLQASNCIAIAYETVTDQQQQLPLLTPMSEIAGRLSVQAGAYHLQKTQAGLGLLLGGAIGVEAANVVIIGAGTAGSNAAQMAIGLGANVTIIDNNLVRLQSLAQHYHSRINTVYSTQLTIAKHVATADLLIGSVLIPGASAPKLVSQKMIQQMRDGSVLVDIAIDQGGCFATSRATTHDQPTYVQDGVIHYCVTNMPAAVARTATFALNNATLPFILEIANKGLRQALIDNPYLRDGVNIYRGHITHAAVADTFSKPYQALEELL